MKKLLLFAAFVVGSFTSALAQNYCVVNSEKVFKSISEYNKALTELDKLADEYDVQVQNEFSNVESLYADFEKEKSSMADTRRQQVEGAIRTMEMKANQLNDDLFGKEGKLMKRRVELIEPIQKRVFAAIEACAKSNGADMVIDSANNNSLLYSNPKIDYTQKVIDALK